MKKTYILYLLSIFMVFLGNSCRQNPDPQPSPVVYSAPSIQILGGEWSDPLFQHTASFNQTTSSVSLTIQPVQSKVKYSLWGAFTLSYDLSTSTDSPANIFAMEKIRERTRPIIEYYENNMEPQTDGHQWFANIYMRDLPTVVADKQLFGTSPGEDLASFFDYVRGVKMKVTGPDYSVEDLVIPERIAMTDYFSKGTMIPLQFFLSSSTIPEDLSVDNDITLTLVFPVTVEHYWSWLLELYENPEAKESFTETEIVLSVNLKDL